jgi:GNAT superfamily N-acetyltransferase
MNYDIVPATPEDSPTLSSIALEAKAYWGYPQEWLELWKPDITISPEMIEAHDCFKVVSGNTIIGFTLIMAEKGGFEIEHCWILPKYIGKGYGGKLLRYALSQPQYQRKHFGVLADPNAEAFYEKFGFKKIKDVPGKPEGRTLPWMEMINQ